jgi:hypothetical protein
MGKHSAVARLFPYIHTIESELARSDALLAVADSFLCDSGALVHDYTAWLRGVPVRTARSGVLPAAASAPPRLTDELFLLITVLANMEAHPEFFTKLRGVLPVEAFTEGYAKELYIAMEEWFRGGGGDGIPGVVSRVEPGQLRSFVMEKCSGPEFSDEAERLFEDSLRTLRKQRLEARRKDIVQRLRLLGREADGGRAAKEGQFGRETEALLEDKMYIDRELRSL